MIHIDPDARDNRWSVQLRENARALLIFNQHVIRPAEIAVDTARLEYRVDGGQAESHRHKRQRIGRESTSEYDGDVETGFRFRMPLTLITSNAGGLLFGNNGCARGAAGRRQTRGLEHRGIGGSE